MATTNKWIESNVRKIRSVGVHSGTLQVSIPQELLEKVGLKAGDNVEFTRGRGVNSDMIMFRKELRRGR